MYYTRTPAKPLKQWESDVVNAGSTTLTTISNLIPHEIYTFRVQAETLAGPGPISVPVRAKTQQGGERDGRGRGEVMPVKRWASHWRYGDKRRGKHSRKVSLSQQCVSQQVS